MSTPNPRKFAPLLVLALIGATYGGYSAWQSRQPFEWSGTVEVRAISVGSKTGGRVSEVLVHEGDDVKASQTIVTLEPGDLNAQRAMAQAQLDQAAANLSKLEVGSRPEEIEQAKARAATATAAYQETRAGARAEETAAARARLDSAAANLERAKLDFDRAKKLYDVQTIPKAELDASEMTLRAAQGQKDAAQQAYDELKAGSRPEDVVQAAARAQEAQASAKLVTSGTRVEDIASARAQVDAAKGRIDQVLALIDELTIRAPRDARIESLDLRPGDILGPNATAATLLEIDQLYVRIYVPETLLGRVKIGQKIAIFVDSFPNRAFPGVVQYIAEQGEYSPRNLQTADERADRVFLTRVGIESGAADLRAGMAATARVPK